MITKDVQSLLGKIVEILVAEYQPERIILFGSHAYGEPNRASDVDLLILKETEEILTRGKALICPLNRKPHTRPIGSKSLRRTSSVCPGDWRRGMSLTQPFTSSRPWKSI